FRRDCTQLSVRLYGRPHVVVQPKRENCAAVAVTAPSKPRPRGGVLLYLKPVPWSCCRAVARRKQRWYSAIFRRIFWQPVRNRLHAKNNRFITDFLPSELQ